MLFVDVGCDLRFRLPFRFYYFHWLQLTLAIHCLVDWLLLPVCRLRCWNWKNLMCHMRRFEKRLNVMNLLFRHRLRVAVFETIEMNSLKLV